MRAELDGDRLGEPEVILDRHPAAASSTTADGWRSGPTATSTPPPARPATPSSPRTATRSAGKILRITTDGEPGARQPGPDSRSGRWGHRNVQGLAFDDDGPAVGLGVRRQHLRRAQPDREGRQLRLARRSRAAAARRTTSTRSVVWSTDEASPSGLAYARRPPLDGGAARRAAVADRRDGERAGDPSDFFVGDYGRLRTVAVAPDGDAVGDHVQPRRPRRPGRRATTGSCSSTRDDPGHRRPARRPAQGGQDRRAEHDIASAVVIARPVSQPPVEVSSV